MADAWQSEDLPVTLVESTAGGDGEVDQRFGIQILPDDRMREAAVPIEAVRVLVPQADQSFDG